MKIIVTGGAGFIGSALVRHLIRHTSHEVLVIDKLTYAGNLASLASVQGHSRYQFSLTDICDRPAISKIFSSFDPDAVMHLAAESHVDRSIDGPAEFINTNVVGTYVLLDAALEHWRKLGTRAKNFRFLHVSTDEVYGALERGRIFHRRHPDMIHVPLIQPPRRHPTIWYERGGIPMVCPSCSPTAQTITDRINFPKS